MIPIRYKEPIHVRRALTQVFINGYLNSLQSDNRRVYKPDF